jgi:hypothetical protein
VADGDEPGKAAGGHAMIALLSLLLAGQAPAPAMAPEDAGVATGLELICYAGTSHFAPQGGDLGARQVELDITGDRGRMQMPHGVTARAKPRWVPLHNLRINDHEIDATASTDFLSSTPVHIDRLTGTIAIGDPRKGFTGRCETYDQAIAHRAF